MTRIALIAAAAALALPAVAFAEPKPEADTAPVTAAVVKHAPRYCVVDEATTGTRLEKRSCKSLEAWLAEGYDPRAKR